ncbi:MAG: 23S rRNA (pseudouridine(1915)-N(3))-methyltransferase RlmH [Geovibrio sp.]|nr:23S rRNA (pseudouridine(1915)-N(3))-methyltransferase RlmH [Geovibrio sp.]
MIKLLVAGKIKEDYLKKACEDYIKRISKFDKIEVIEIEKNIEEKMLNILNRKDYNIALTIDGKKMNSIEFAKKIENQFIYNPKIVFIIGESEGIPPKVLESCDEKISFSDLTFPHQLFRVMLLEQIYRSYKINSNQEYHK